MMRLSSPRTAQRRPVNTMASYVVHTIVPRRLVRPHGSPATLRTARAAPGSSLLARTRAPPTPSSPGTAQPTAKRCWRGRSCRS
eukprot:6315774-Prymnesium_polylepis.1